MKPLLIFLTLTLGLQTYAQDNKTVTLIVSGQGKTEDEAKQIALRSAIEQAFGTFISSETVINNDSFVSDNITSLSQGSVIGFQVLSSYGFPDNSIFLTMKAVVSITEMQKLTESQGHSVTISGGLFGMNIKLAKLQSDSEIKVVSDMTKICKQILGNSIDYNISIDPPKKSDLREDLQVLREDATYSKSWYKFDSLIVENIYKIRFIIECKPNSNLDVFIDYFLNTLNTIKMSYSEIDFATTSGTQYFKLRNNLTKEIICLRSKESVKLLEQLFDDATLYLVNYKVVSNEGIVDFSPIKSLSFKYFRSWNHLHVIDPDHYVLTRGLLNERRVGDDKLDVKYPSDLKELNGQYIFNLYKTDSDSPYTNERFIWHSLVNIYGWMREGQNVNKFTAIKGFMNVRYQVIDYFLPLKDIERLEEIKVIKNN